MNNNNNNKPRKNRNSGKRTTNQKSRFGRRWTRKDGMENMRRGSSYDNYSSGTGEPDIQRRRLVYEDYFQFSNGSTPTFLQVFRGNSLFDPDYTNIGHQPLYFDTYSQVYNKYRVLGSKITCSVVNGSGTTSGTLCIAPSTDLISPTTTYELKEYPYSVTTGVLPLAGNGEMRITSAATTNKICGLRHNAVYDEDYSALVTSNPTAIWYWHLFAASNSGVVNFLVRIRIVYDCEFYDRRSIAPSYEIIKNPEDLSHGERKELGLYMRDDENFVYKTAEVPFMPIPVTVMNSVAATVLNPILNVKIAPLANNK